MTFGASPFGGAEFATGVAIQKDGKLVVAGRTVTGGSADNFGITRVLANGTGLDPSFNSNGKLTVDFGFDDEGNAMVLDNDGRIVVVGSMGGDFALARIIGKVDRATSLIVSGSVDGRGTEFSPNAAGTFGSPFRTPANLFPGFAGNVRSAVADVNGDGFEDAILVTGPGTPIRYAVISGVDDVTPLIPPTAPFAGSEDFEGGGFVAAGDLDGDGRAEFIVMPDQGGGPRVTIFSLVGTTPTVRANFFGIDDPTYRGGARAALGDVNADGTPDLAVSAGFLGGPRTALFNGRTLFATPTRLVSDFFAFPGADAVTLRNGTFVTLGDINGDGFADLIFGGGPGGAPRVFILNGLIVSTGTIDAAYAAPLANFFVAGNSTDRGGVRVAAIDGDSDHRTDLAVGSGEGSVTNVRAYLGKNFTGVGEPAIFQDISVFGGLPLTGGVFVG